MEKKTKIATIVGFILCICVIALLGVKLLEKPKESGPSSNLVLDTSAEAVAKGKEELANRQVYFYGIVDGSISKDAPILLQNPKANDDICIKYTVIDERNDKVIFETDLIESGKGISWYPGEKLSAGVYNFTVIEQPYYQPEGAEGYLPLTVGNNHIVIELTES